MPDARLLLGASNRTGFVEAAALNCLVERDPVSATTPMAMIARPGLQALTTVGTAPIRAIFQSNGLFDDSALVVADTGCFTVTRSGVVTPMTGVSITGDDLVVVAAAQDADGVSVARFATGTAMFRADGPVLTQETFPDSGNAGATSVGYIQGYWIGTVPGSDYAYYIEPAGTVWNAIQFAAAEYAFDRLIGAKVFGELIGMLGEETFEVWRVTGDAASPLEPAGGLKRDIGCKSIHAAVNCAGTLIWPDHTGAVWKTSGGEPEIISTPGLAEQIARTARSDLRGTFWVKDQHPVYQLTLGTEATWLYDMSSGEWTKATSLGLDYWRAHLSCSDGETVLAADALTNQVWVMDPDQRDDDGEVFPLVFTARIEAPSGVYPLYNVELDCLLGEAPRTGQGSDPQIGLQISRDGVTYGGTSYRTLGATGARSVAPRWNALGQIRGPFGALLKFTVSDPVGRRFSAVRYNV